MFDFDDTNEEILESNDKNTLLVKNLEAKILQQSVNPKCITTKIYELEDSSMHNIINLDNRPLDQKKSKVYHGKSTSHFRENNRIGKGYDFL